MKTTPDDLREAICDLFVMVMCATRGHTFPAPVDLVCFIKAANKVAEMVGAPPPFEVKLHPWESASCGGCKLAATVRASDTDSACVDHEKPDENARPH